MTIDNLTTPAAIQAVIDNPNWVIRNLQITQSYHELNLAVDRYLADANVSWCAFATWASKQAGRFIRNEEVPPKLRRFLQLDASDTQPWYTKLTLYRLLRSKPVLRYLHCTVADVGFPLGEGNHLVYAKLAPLFARFLVLIREPQPPHPEQFNIYDAGESYTEHEHRVWLRAAGFVEIECADFFLAGGGRRLITARKRG